MDEVTPEAPAVDAAPVAEEAPAVAPEAPVADEAPAVEADTPVLVIVVPCCRDADEDEADDDEAEEADDDNTDEDE